MITGTTRTGVRPLVPLLIIYLALTLWYSVTTPIFEGPDENEHFLVAYNMATTLELPILDYANPQGERHQLPLYYLMVATVLRLAGTDDPTDFLVRNPHAAVSGVISPGNKNAFLHGHPDEQWPFTGVPLAVHLGRLVSVGLGMLTIASTYGLALALFGLQRRWIAAAAAGLVAFSPQFVFITAVINNDNAVAAFATLTLWLLARYFKLERTLWRLVILGIAAGLTALTKATGLPILAVVLAGLAWKELRENQMRRLLLDVPIVAASSLLVSGWWYGRNLVLYGDPLLGRYLSSWYRVDNYLPAGVDEIVTRAVEAIPSYWGVFGWLNIAWPEPIYMVLRIWVALSALGLFVFVIRWVREPDPSITLFPLAMSLLWTVLVMVPLGSHITVIGGLQGRLLFPAIGAIAVILMLGWTSLFPRSWQATAAVPVCGLLILALVTPITTLGPAYEAPQVLTREQLPSEMIPTDLRMGEDVRLIGYRSEPGEAVTGETVDVIVYWEVLRPPHEDFSVFVSLLGRDLSQIGGIDTMPGLGNLPTSRWQAGQIIEDVYPIPVDPQADAPVLASLSSGWGDPNGQIEVVERDGQGNPTTIFGQLKVIPAQWPEPSGQAKANFADQILLDDYQIELEAPNRLLVSLDWLSQSQPDADYTVFVHVLDGDGQIVAQTDQVPRQGSYPTSRWKPGEVIQDHVQVTLPDSVDQSQPLTLSIGLYRADNGARLPIVEAKAEVLSDSVHLPLAPQP